MGRVPIIHAHSHHIDFAPLFFWYHTKYRRLCLLWPDAHPFPWVDWRWLSKPRHLESNQLNCEVSYDCHNRNKCDILIAVKCSRHWCQQRWHYLRSSDIQSRSLGYWLRHACQLLQRVDLLGLPNYNFDTITPVTTFTTTTTCTYSWSWWLKSTY